MNVVSNNFNSLLVPAPLNNVAVGELPFEFQELLNPTKPLMVEQFEPQIA